MGTSKYDLRIHYIPSKHWEFIHRGHVLCGPCGQTVDTNHSKLLLERLVQARSPYLQCSPQCGSPPSTTWRSQLHNNAFLWKTAEQHYPRLFFNVPHPLLKIAGHLTSCTNMECVSRECVEHNLPVTKAWTQVPYTRNVQVWPKNGNEVR